MAQTIQHVVVLMLENRAFDHMVGFLTPKTGHIEGLTGTEFNPSDPVNPIDQHFVTRSAGLVLTPDPGHSIPDTNVQLFANPQGPPPVGAASSMGFVWNYSQQHHAPANPAAIMDCFDPSTLPVLTTLATEFAICDRWFSSVPGPTWPNRFFAHSATSGGHIGNSMFTNYDMPTIFESLADRGFTWRDYYHDFSQTWALQRLQTPSNRVNFRSFGQFKRDARDGTLPNYSFIEPKYFSLFGEANDQHPPHNMLAGEKLIADVYEAVRTGPQWLNTLLLVTYDEHGGTYDHVLPPAAVPPDGLTSQFPFDRYGLRVPAIVISPFVAAEPVHTEFDHTSIPATLAAVFALPTFLSARDARANPFHGLASLGAARTDVPDLSTHAAAEPTLSARGRAQLATVGAAPVEAAEELSDFQLDLVKLAQSLEREHAPMTARPAGVLMPPKTEPEAALYVRRVAAQMSIEPEEGEVGRAIAPGAVAEGVAARRYSYRVRVRQQSDACFPFAHAVDGVPVEVRFVVTDSQGRTLGTSRYVTTFDDPYGSGDLDDPNQNALPPVVFNGSDDNMFVEVRASVGGPSFGVPLEADVDKRQHGVTVVSFLLDARPLLTLFVRT